MLCKNKIQLKYLKENEYLVPVFSELCSPDDNLKNYTPIKVIGKGGFSIVTLARRKDTGILYVIKTVNKDFLIQNRRIEHALAERRILSNMSHPFVIQIYSSFQTVFFI